MGAHQAAWVVDAVEQCRGLSETLLCRRQLAEVAVGNARCFQQIGT